MDAVANAEGGPKGERQEGANHRTGTVRFPYVAEYSEITGNFAVVAQAMVAGDGIEPPTRGFSIPDFGVSGCFRLCHAQVSSDNNQSLSVSWCFRGFHAILVERGTERAPD
jgi:hypothetical protein